ncbi:MAG: SDR family NAD(P)-dependent oxidoreductase, partial [Planctomycetes bacterium]|nr:SDR family NAD(P)-dependent oxidoreductase [Planctomycetota bacterium]
MTGAGSGIGRATAIELALAGARVAVTDIDAENAGSTAREITAAGGVAQSFRMDVSDTDQIAQVSESVR